MKDQGQCGSCWSYLTTEDIEPAILHGSGNFAGTRGAVFRCFWAKGPAESSAKEGSHAQEKFGTWLRGRGVLVLHPFVCPRLVFCLLGHVHLQPNMTCDVVGWLKSRAEKSTCHAHCCSVIKHGSGAGLVPERGSREQIADVHASQIVEQIIGVPEMAGQILDVPVLETVEQSVKLPSTVSDDRIQQRTAEHIVDISVPQDEEEPAEFFMASSQDRVQLRFWRTDH